MNLIKSPRGGGIPKQISGYEEPLSKVVIKYSPTEKIISPGL
jgi:hypothetical protein